MYVKLGFFLHMYYSAFLKPFKSEPNPGKSMRCTLPDYSDCRGSGIQKHEYFSWFPKHPDPETILSIENYYDKKFSKNTDMPNH